MQEKLTIAVEPDFLPLTSVKEGKADGMIIEILQDVFAHSGQTIEFAAVPLAEHLTTLAAGEIDAIAFKAITPGLPRGCDFSTPIIKTGAAWFGPLADPWSLEVSAKRPRIATPGTGPLAGTLRTKFPGLEIIETTSYDASLKAVVASEADVAALNFHIGSYLAGRGYSHEIAIPEQPYEELNAALAVAEDDPKNILEYFNLALKIVIQAGRVDQIERKWLQN